MPNRFFFDGDYGEVVETTQEAYIKAKTQDLREFGYPTLSEDEVRQQLENVLAGKKTTVIGEFIRSDNVRRV